MDATCMAGVALALWGMAKPLVSWECDDSPFFGELLEPPSVNCLAAAAPPFALARNGFLQKGARLFTYAAHSIASIKTNCDP